VSLKVGITGADGLIGWHLRAWLRAHRPDVVVRLAIRSTFADSDELSRFAADLDAIVHCAGMNRGADAEVEATNADLARKLVKACEAAAEKNAHYPQLVFANSTHADCDTAYGRGKRMAAEIFDESARRHGAVCSNLILPHVFGEFGKPFYNSVVSTFCHQLALGEIPQIHVDGDLELVHAQFVAANCIAAIEDAIAGDVRIPGVPLKVSALLDKLAAMAESYIGRNIVPNLINVFDLALFNTLRSYRFPLHVQIPLALHKDDRGALFEAVKTDNGGQTFLSTTYPGVTRGNHFHTYKFERFLVCSGEAEIRLRRLFADDVKVFHVSGDSPCCIDMPTFYTHSITNTGSGELVTLFWASEIFNSARPDTFPETVLS
jgi:UDP-2-acetamido-2,6-beta-L-arabino-hexul-4-ose reductase